MLYWYNCILYHNGQQIMINSGLNLADKWNHIYYHFVLYIQHLLDELMKSNYWKCFTSWFLFPRGKLIFHLLNNHCCILYLCRNQTWIWLKTYTYCILVLSNAKSRNYNEDTSGDLPALNMMFEAVILPNRNSISTGHSTNEILFTA